jgi:hypothetical protein
MWNRLALIPVPTPPNARHAPREKSATRLRLPLTASLAWFVVEFVFDMLECGTLDFCFMFV